MRGLEKCEGDITDRAIFEITWEEDRASVSGRREGRVPRWPADTDDELFFI